MSRYQESADFENNDVSVEVKRAVLELRERPILEVRKAIRMCTEVGSRRMLCEDEFGEGHESCQALYELEKVCFSQVFCPIETQAFRRCVEELGADASNEDVKSRCSPLIDDMFDCMSASLERVSKLPPDPIRDGMSMQCAVEMRNAEHCYILAEHEADERAGGAKTQAALEKECEPFAREARRCAGRVACPSYHAKLMACEATKGRSCESEELDLRACVQNRVLQDMKTLGFAIPKLE